MLYKDICRVFKVTATDNSGSVQVTTDKPDEFNKPGLRIINYVAVDGSGNQDSCTFSVNITGE